MGRLPLPTCLRPYTRPVGFGFFIVLGVIGAVVGFAVMRIQRTRQLTAWQQAADELGIAVEQGPWWRAPQLTGSVSGLTTVVDIVSESSGNNNTTYTRYRVLYPSLGLGLRLARESGFTKVVRFFGAQDHTVGDEAFDQAFEVKGSDPAALAAYLTPGRRESLMRLQAAYPGSVITDDHIQYRKVGTELDAGTIISVVRRLVGAAATLTNTRIAEQLDGPLRRRLDGELTASVDHPAVVHPHPDDIDRALLDVETLYGSNREDSAREVLAGLEDIVPEDPEVRGWRQTIDADTTRTTTPTDDLLTDPVAISTELFGSQRLSFETRELFERTYDGAPVRWTGTVRRATHVDADRDFPGGPMTRAIVHMASISNDLYGIAEVDAVVQFPPRTRLESGQQITFTGTLVNVDSLIRNLFVADGSLV